MKIGHLNVRSLLCHFNELMAHILECKYDVVAISETWLTHEISTATVYIPGYIFVRKDRGTRGGGVGFYIRDSVHFKLIQSNTNIEQLWLSIRVHAKMFVFGVVYRPPNTQYRCFVEELELSFANCLPISEQVICLGDLNIDLLKPDNPATVYLMNALEAVGFRQIIKQPTRITETRVSLLDLIIVTDMCLVKNIGVHNVEISDHELVYCEILITGPIVEPKALRYRDFNNFDLQLLREHLALSKLDDIFYVADINAKIHIFSQRLIELFNIHAPFKTVTITKPIAPWITENIKLLMHLRDKAKSKFRRTKNVVHWNSYKEIRNYVKNCISNEKKAYFKHILKTSDSKTLWKEFSRLNISNKNYVDLPVSLQNADEINKYFMNSIPNASLSNNKLISHYRSQTKNNIGSIFKFELTDEDTISKIIFAISSKSSGSDGLTIKMIKLCCPYILKYLVHILNSCILENTFPDAWKHAYVIPLPKVANPKQYSDLRPISLLSVLSKIFEKIINMQLRQHVNNHNILPAHQSGFRAGHSCETALLDITDSILSATDKGFVSVLTLLDFSKAFDTVDHNILTSILHYIGLNDDAASLLHSFLTSRTQAVKIKNFFSRTVSLVTGVPQGSILSPLLFSLYTCDLFKSVKKCCARMYADDTQIYYSFSPRNYHIALQDIQNDLDVVFSVCSEHSLYLNPSKSSIILFGNQKLCKNLKNVIHLRMGGKEIAIVDEVKNLGLYIDNSFRYRTQIVKYIQRAFINLRMLYQHRSYLAKDIKLLLCNSLVLSHFVYCATVYGPCIDVCNQNRIQRVQNACLRYVYGIRKYDRISHTLRICNWLNMRNRVTLRAACLYHSIVQFKSPVYLYEKISFRTDVHNLNIRNKGLITPPIHRTALYERSFSYSIYKLYNAIPDSMKSLTKNSFKRTMQQHLLALQFDGGRLI